MRSMYNRYFPVFDGLLSAEPKDVSKELFVV
jgi:hypothetical protein